MSKQSSPLIQAPQECPTTRRRWLTLQWFRHNPLKTKHDGWEDGLQEGEYHKLEHHIVRKAPKHAQDCCIEWIPVITHHKDPICLLDSICGVQIGWWWRGSRGNGWQRALPVLVIRQYRGQRRRWHTFDRGNARNRVGRVVKEKIESGAVVEEDIREWEKEERTLGSEGTVLEVDPPKDQQGAVWAH